MKTLKSFFAVIAILTFFFSSPSAHAQKEVEVKIKTPEKKQNKVVVKIKTSAQCDMCKQRIEKEMAYVKGVKKAVVNVEKNEITVTYNPQKITIEKIREEISKIGYDADDVKAEEKAYKNLPGCCQKDGMKHE